jgi:type IV pilus assembly protein PilZ
MGRRQLLRIDAKVEVEFKSFEQFSQEYTKNISQGGLFIKSNEPLAPQSVLEISLILPDGPEHILVVGEVVHTIDKETASARGCDAGMGVHFVDYEETAKQTIENYISKKYLSDPKIKSPDRRRHVRVPMRLRVKFPNLHTLLEDFAYDISRGGIFIETESPKRLGEALVVTLVHPETSEELDLDGEVVRVSRHDPKQPNSVSGMAIKFVNMDEKKRKAIDQFLAVEYPIGD